MNVIMERLVQDLRFALRVLVRNPVFSLAALVALALGIGANSVILSAVNAVLLRPLPFEDSQRIVRLFSSERGILHGVSQDDLRDWRARSRVFEAVAAFQERVVTLTGLGEPRHIQAAAVSPELFPLLGSAPILGHAGLAAGETPEEIPTVVVSHRFWKRELNGRRDAVGREVDLNGQAASVIGVMGPDFWFPSRDAELWIPLRPPSPPAGRGRRELEAVARLKPGVGLEHSRRELKAIASDLGQRHPETNQGVSAALVPLHEQLVGDSRGPLLMLMAAVLLVLLITCANVANLLLARAAARQREIGIRTALGAGRGRLLRQLLTESLLLALVGGLLGLPVAHWALLFLSSSVPSGLAGSMPGIQYLRIDFQAFLLTMAVALLAGVVFGLLPALRASRSDLIEVLKPSAADSSPGLRSGRLSRLLVIVETALVLTLLITSSLAIRSFLRLQQVDPGFEADRVLTMRLDLPSFKYPAQDQVVNFYRQVKEQVLALPEAGAVSLASRVPLGGGGGYARVEIAGRGESRQRPRVPSPSIGPDYFRAMGIPLAEGRPFGRHEESLEPTVIVNQAFARRHWRGESPLGERIRLDGEPEDRRVVAVARDVKNGGLVWPPHPEIYLPYQQKPARGMYLVVNTSRPPLEIVDAVRRRVWSVDDQQPITRIRTLQQYVSDWAAPRRLFATILGVFSLVSLVLALVGIYGLVSFSVNRQTRQIGIRMALGALPRQILWRVLSRTFAMLAAGVALGLGGAWAFGQALSSALFLYGVSPTDILSFSLLPALLMAVGLAAAGVPALRASNVDPATALREE